MFSKAVLLSIAGSVCAVAAVTGPACGDGTMGDLMAMGSTGCVYAPASVRLFDVDFSATINGGSLDPTTLPMRFSTVPVGIGINRRDSLFLSSLAAASVPSGAVVAETISFSLEFLSGSLPNRMVVNLGGVAQTSIQTADILSFSDSRTFAKSPLFEAVTVLGTPQFTTAVPEPSTWCLFGIGMIAGWLWRQHRASNRYTGEKRFPKQDAFTRS